MTTTPRIIALAALLLLSTTALSAAERPANPWRVSVLAAEISESKEVWNDLHAGIGVGVAYAFAADWDVELTAAQQSYRSPVTRFVPFPGGAPNFPQVVPVTEFRRYTVHPIDLTATKHFMTDRAVAPFLRAGVRYVDAPADVMASTITVFPVTGTFVPVTTGFGFNDRTSVEAGGGVRVRMTANTALRIEAMRLLRDRGVTFDPLTRAAAGVSWKF